jgi:hypothetical protein
MGCPAAAGRPTLRAAWRAARRRPAAAGVRAADGRVVVRAAADGQAERQPAVGELVDGDGLLGEQRGRAGRREHDVRRQLDPVRDHRRGGEAGQRVVCRECDAVDRR